MSISVFAKCYLIDCFDDAHSYSPDFVNTDLCEVRRGQDLQVPET